MLTPPVLIVRACVRLCVACGLIDGEHISLDDEGSSLPMDMKSLALGKLQGLQDKVMTMIARLGTK